MAYTGSTEAVSAGAISAKAADKPMLIAANALEYSDGDPKWHETVDTTRAAATDRTASGYVTTRAYDRYHHTYTRATGVAVDTLYFKMQFATATVTDFDCFIILGHNYDSIGTDSLQFSLEISDNADYSSPTTEGPYSIVSGSAASSLPVAYFFTTRYQGVQYAQLKIYDSTGNFSAYPQIGELYLGRRRQLSRKPLSAGWDPTPWGHVGSVFESDSGVDTVYSFNEGGVVVAPRFNPNPDDDKYSLDDVANLQEFWKECNYGRKNFCWIADPGTYPTRVHHMRAAGSGGARLAMPFRGAANSRSWAPVLKEQAPFLQPLIG